MSRALDRPGSVRPGEEIDGAKLAAYLRAKLPELGAGSVEIEQFPSGYSNLTYLVRAGGRELVLRRPPFGSKVATAHDMGREHRILSRLSEVYEAPRPLLYCGDASVLGAPFYLMERARGVILRAQLPPGVAPTPAEARALGESFARQLARLHAVDYEAAGLGDLGRPEGYVERQVEGWRRRYRGSQTDDLPELERAGEWLAANIPAPSGAALVHNDFKYDNLVLDPEDLTRVRAVLDWELATLGDPLLDLGTSLGYWVEADDPEPLRRFKFGPTDLPGSPTRAEIADLYATASGRPVEDLAYYYCFGLFKIAVIAQQIYYRYARGLTHDERFAALPGAIRALAERAARIAAS